MKRSNKYVGLDVHQATTVSTVREESGRVVARSVVPTEAAALVEYVRGMRGAVHVAFEEGTQAQWLRDRRAWADSNCETPNVPTDTSISSGANRQTSSAAVVTITGKYMSSVANPRFDFRFPSSDASGRSASSSPVARRSSMERPPSPWPRMMQKSASSDGG